MTDVAEIKRRARQKSDSLHQEQGAELLGSHGPAEIETSDDSPSALDAFAYGAADPLNISQWLARQADKDTVAGAGLRWLADIEPGDSAEDMARQGRDMVRDAHPVAFGAGQATTGIATGVATAPLLATAAGTGGMAAATGAGALEGAVSGYADSGELDDAATGAAVGGLTGATGDVAMRGIGALARAAGKLGVGGEALGRFLDPARRVTRRAPDPAGPPAPRHGKTMEMPDPQHTIVNESSLPYQQTQQSIPKPEIPDRGPNDPTVAHNMWKKYKRQGLRPQQGARPEDVAEARKIMAEDWMRWQDYKRPPDAGDVAGGHPARGARARFEEPAFQTLRDAPKVVPHRPRPDPMQGHGGPNVGKPRMHTEAQDFAASSAIPMEHADPWVGGMSSPRELGEETVPELLEGIDMTDGAEEGYRYFLDQHAAGSMASSPAVAIGGSGREFFDSSMGIGGQHHTNPYARDDEEGFSPYGGAVGELQKDAPPATVPGERTGAIARAMSSVLPELREINPLLAERVETSIVNGEPSMIASMSRQLRNVPGLNWASIDPMRQDPQ